MRDKNKSKREYFFFLEFSLKVLRAFCFENCSRKIDNFLADRIFRNPKAEIYTYIIMIIIIQVCVERERKGGRKS